MVNLRSPGPSPKNVVERKSDASDATSSYFVVRRSSRKSTPTSNSSEASPSLGHQRPVLQWSVSSSPSTRTSYFGTPNLINPTVSDRDSVSTRVTAGGDPPRSAKSGHEWVWYPAGYWAEREIPTVPAPRRSRFLRSDPVPDRSEEQASRTKRRKDGTIPTSGKSTPCSVVLDKVKTRKSSGNSSNSVSDSPTRSTLSFKGHGPRLRRGNIPKVLSYLATPEGHCRTKSGLGLNKAVCGQVVPFSLQPSDHAIDGRQLFRLE